MPNQQQPNCDCCGRSNCAGCCSDLTGPSVLADFGSFGWTNDSCSACTTFGGEYTCDHIDNVFGETGCRWKYTAATACTWLKPDGCFGDLMWVTVRVLLLNNGDGTCTLSAIWDFDTPSKNETCGTDP